jgi:hypothetical protein
VSSRFAWLLGSRKHSRFPPALSGRFFAKAPSLRPPEKVGEMSRDRRLR